MEKTTLQPFNYEAAAEVLMELMAQFMRTDLNRSLQAMVHGECFALLLLNSADTWLLPSDLSARLSVSSARITKLLDTLESKQIIVRQPDPNDRRKTRVCLTPVGRSQADLILNEIRSNAVFTLSHLSPQDVENFLRILRQIVELAPEVPYPPEIPYSFPGGKS